MMIQRSLLLIFYCLFPLSFFPQSTTILDSLINGFDTASSDSLKYVYADELFWQLIYTDKDKSVSYGQEALSLAQQLNKPNLIAAAYNNMAIYHRISGTYRQGDSVLRLAIELQQQSGDSSGLARSYGNLANIYKAKDQYEKGIEANLQALSYYESTNDQKGTSICLTNIGGIHFSLKQYKEALDYYQRSLIISQALNDTLGMAQNLGNIGTAQKQLENTDAALKAYLDANVFIENLGYQQSLAINLGNIGVLYRDHKDYDKATQYFSRAASIFTKFNAPKELSRLYDNLAKTALLQLNYTDAYNYAQQALQLAEKIGARAEIRSAYQSLYQTFAAQNDFQQAFQFQEAYVLLNDSLINESNTKAIQELETRYETEKKEREIILLQQQQKIQHQTIAAQKAGIKLRNVIILLILLGLMSAILGIFSYRQKQLLTQKENELQQQKLIELQQQQKMVRMNAVIHGEEQERRRIAKDLHDGVGSMLAAAKLQLGIYEDQFSQDSQAQKTYTLVSDTYEEVRRIAHNMMPKALLELGLVSAIRQLGEQLDPGKRMKIDIEEIQNIPPQPAFNELVIYRIVQELLTNILKHAHATEAFIQFSFFEDELTVSVEDNGVGFDEKHVSKGLGLQSIQQRIEYLEGEIEIDSKEGKGTVVTLRIPVSKQAKSYDPYIVS